MMTRSKGKENRYWAIQVVHVEDPPITSPAQLVLLAKQYFTQDKSIYTEFRMHKIRNKWMKEQMREHLDEMSGLTCAICRRKGLNPWTKDVKKRVVLDHIIEISQNGPWDDPNNFQVLCDQCNRKKNDRLQPRKGKNKSPLDIL